MVTIKCTLFAWAVVEKKCKDSWVWFLSLLKSDIDTADGAGFTLISDQQKVTLFDCLLTYVWIVCFDTNLLMFAFTCMV
jgi:hypothetical protein